MWQSAALCGSLLQSVEVRDELKLKYAGTRFQKYASCPIEASAQFWMRKEMGWTQSIPERMPT